jgi:hypothetical protein
VPSSIPPAKPTTVSLKVTQVCFARLPSSSIAMNVRATADG